MTTHVIIDSASGDVLSIPMSLGICGYIADQEREIAAATGRPCPLEPWDGWREAGPDA